MNKNIILMILALFFSSVLFSNEIPEFCNSKSFTCHQIKANFVIAYPNKEADAPQHKKANVPNDTYYHTDKSNGTYYNTSKSIINVDLNNLTWHAYDNGGKLIRSGHVSGGREYCADLGTECKTVTGIFTIYKKGGGDCKSTIFPLGQGGGLMPYCMFFHGGYALHGAHSVPNYNASHGCVRMSPKDAQWLNENFVQVGVTQVHVHY